VAPKKEESHKRLIALSPQSRSFSGPQLTTNPAATKEARHPNKKIKTKGDRNMAIQPAHATARDMASNELMTD